MPETVTNIPAPRVPFIDERSGQMSREWYQFLLSLFRMTGLGGGDSGDFVSKDGDTMTGPLVIEVDSASTALRVTQTGDGDALRIEDTTNPDSSPIIVDGSGRFVHGHTSAIEAFSSITPFAQLHGTVASFVANAGYMWSTTATRSAELMGLKSNSSTIGTHAAVTTGDVLLDVSGAGSDGTEFIETASIRFSADANATDGIVPGRVALYTADEFGEKTERQRWDSEGVVNIFGNLVVSEDVRVGGFTLTGVGSMARHFMMMGA